MKDYESYLKETEEYGVVEQIYHPLVVVAGLPSVKPSELVLFETGELGEVFSIHKDSVDILVFSKSPLKVGTKVVRTDKHVSIGVHDSMLGMVIDPLGFSLDGKQILENVIEQELDVAPLGINKRSKISKSFLTGVALVDMMIPLGYGQKQLVVGDRKTGKTSFLLSTIKTQAKQGTKIVFASIGKKKHDIKKLMSFFEKEGIQNSIIMVAAASEDPSSLIVLAPYTAMSIAEYFKDKGENVLVILDDLTTHAQFYREISLIAKRFPGRESYPGDIFYMHSRLLERSGNYIHDTKGEVSITCIAVAETIDGDFTSYITTNLIGMTDGHIYFDSNEYYKGRRPPINVSLSVTRVGKQVQQKVKRDINRELSAFLTLYEKMQNFSHFGAELSDSIKLILKTGDRIYKFFDQSYDFVVPEAVQLLLFCMVWLKLLDDVSDKTIKEYRETLSNLYLTNPSVKQTFDKLINAASFNHLLGEIMTVKDEILVLCKTKN